MKNIDKSMGGWLRKTILDPALWATLVIAALIASLGNEHVLQSETVAVGTAEVAMAGALLGIVLAGLAILVVFLDEKYIALLQQVPPGFDADLWPFKFTALLSIICKAFGMSLILIGNPTSLVLRIVLGFSLWSFSYLLWTMYDLVKFIAGHAKARVTQIQKKNDS